MNKRIIFDIVLLSSVFYAPWWIVVMLAIVGAYIYDKYYEIFLFGILIDLLYGANLFPLGGALGILGAIVIFVSVSYAKKMVR
ncbi:MAG TPA: hypothetical protein DCS23_00635 [Candidatus Yonathbacteria bacterium]|nr:hypothetical protein [Candidatus Yonathbacteria bacterium]